MSSFDRDTTIALYEAGESSGDDSLVRNKECRRAHVRLSRTDCVKGDLRKLYPRNLIPVNGGLDADLGVGRRYRAGARR